MTFFPSLGSKYVPRSAKNSLQDHNNKHHITSPILDTGYVGMVFWSRSYACIFQENKTKQNTNSTKTMLFLMKRKLHTFSFIGEVTVAKGDTGRGRGEHWGGMDRSTYPHKKTMNTPTNEIAQKELLMRPFLP